MNNGYPRIHRISIDIDSENQFEFLKKYYNLSRFGKVKAFKTNKGYHLQLFKPFRTLREDMIIRQIVGDCSGRLEYDEYRISIECPDVVETLFYHKNYYGDIGGEDLIDPLHKECWMLKY